MAQYIDKAALVAEIENLKNTYKKCPTRNSYEEGLKEGRLIGYKDALHKIDTLEVKEVDEHKEMMRECPYRQVGCAMYEDKILECRGACGWVVDHLKLKEFKAHKGK